MFVNIVKREISLVVSSILDLESEINDLHGRINILTLRLDNANAYLSTLRNGGDNV